MTLRRLGTALVGLAMVLGLTGWGTASAAPHRTPVAHLTAPGHPGSSLSQRPARDAAHPSFSTRRSLDGDTAGAVAAPRVAVVSMPGVAPPASTARAALGPGGARAPPDAAG
jgi:hypothetical protein